MSLNGIEQRVSESLVKTMLTVSVSDSCSANVHAYVASVGATMVVVEELSFIILAKNHFLAATEKIMIGSLFQGSESC